MVRKQGHNDELPVVERSNGDGKVLDGISEEGLYILQHVEATVCEVGLLGHGGTEAGHVV